MFDQTNFYSGKDDTAIDMLELWDNALTYVLALLFVSSYIPCQRIQYCDSTPLRTFVQGNQELVQNSSGNGKYARIRR